MRNVCWTGVRSVKSFIILFSACHSFTVEHEGFCWWWTDFKSNIALGFCCYDLWILSEYKHVLWGLKYLKFAAGERVSVWWMLWRMFCKRLLIWDSGLVDVGNFPQEGARFLQFTFFQISSWNMAFYSFTPASTAMQVTPIRYQKSSQYLILCHRIRTFSLI